uniref:DUF4220 domain-containing protein n=1 Tax=Oryza nivara TaxID=4536 RepID=A0A0E0HY61_ORYNI
MVRSWSGGSGGRAAFSRATAGGGRFRPMSHSDELTKLAWIGWLIFQNTYYSKSKPFKTYKVVVMFAVLWSLVLAKLLQRLFNEWNSQQSVAAAASDNSCFISSYMSRLEDLQSRPGYPIPVMNRCKYVVMGEEKLLHVAKKKMSDGGGNDDDNVFTISITTPDCGYGVGMYPHHQGEQKHANLLIDMAKSNEVVTVEEITNKIRVLPNWCYCGRQFTQHMHQLCFSFSLFKLLRRRFEHYPLVEVGSRTSRQLLLEEPLVGGGTGNKTTFRVMRQELDFLDRYYDSSAPIPMAMSAPWLIILNYLFSLLFVCTYVAAVSIVLLEVRQHSEALASTLTDLRLYVAVSILVVVTLVAVEFAELLTTYLLSDWFMVHLLCLLAGDGGSRIWRSAFKPAIRLFIADRFMLFYSFRCLLCLSCRGTNVDSTIMLKQVSILRVCEPIHKFLSWSSQVKLAKQGETAIVKVLEDVNIIG